MHDFRSCAEDRQAGTSQFDERQIGVKLQASVALAAKQIGADQCSARRSQKRFGKRLGRFLSNIQNAKASI